MVSVIASSRILLRLPTPTTESEHATDTLAEVIGPPDTHHELWDLENLRTARRLCDWMYEQCLPFVRGEVAEVGSGIGIFSERLVTHPGVVRLLLVEPEDACADILMRTYRSDPRVTVARETLPDSPL